MAYTDIDDPSAYFTTTLYTSNDTNRTITNDANAGDFQPDFLWGKSRNFAEDHNLVNTSVGVTKHLVSNTDAGEVSDTDRVTGVTSNGFSIGRDHRWNRESNSNMVVWQWKCNGGTKADNDDGSITVNLQVNQEAGFSIGTYTGTGSQLTLGHGLGVAPKLHITKKLNSADAWNVYHESIGNTHGLRLNGTGAKEDFGFYGDTSPTSSVFTVGGVTSNDRLNTDGGSYVFYSFAEKQGYSKFGSYVGNGSTNGTFAYTGFKPAWVLVKSVDVAQSWQLSDSARNPSNVVNRRIAPNDTSAESTAHSWIDFLSNGFKIRINDAAYNNNGQDYIYIAFAENPFVSSEGVPTTAR